MAHFLCVYGPWLCLGPQTRKNELGQYADVLIEQGWPVPIYIIKMAKTGLLKSGYILGNYALMLRNT